MNTRHKGVFCMINGITGVGVSPYMYAYNVGRQKDAMQPQTVRPQETAQNWSLRKSASPESPVQPVQPVRPVKADEASIPELMSRYENDPAAMAARMRIQYTQPGTAGQSLMNEDAPVNGQTDEEGPALGIEGAQKALEEGECQTCKERKYQDGSDDPGVSFKTPTNIAPEQAASAVRGHEMEHVVREQAKAQREDRRVVSQTVTMHTAICPECGKAYVSGGTTRTTTKANPEVEAVQKTEEDNQNRTPFTAAA